jgi:hypothetical protein
LGDGLGTLAGTSRWLYDGVQTVTLNGQTINGTLLGPGTGLFFNNNLTVSSSRVYTAHSTFDDGSGNAQLSGNLVVAGGITGATLSATVSMFTPSLSVGGVSIVKPLYALVSVNNSSSGGLNFGTIVFSTGGTFVASGLTFTLPTRTVSTAYLTNLAGTGVMPVTISSGTLLINAPLAAVNVLYLGEANNGQATPQSLTTQSESVLTVGANVSCVVSVSTTVFTSFGGRVTFTQLV